MARLLILILALALLVVPGARAQTPGYARVVTSCGTPPYTYVAGQTVPVLVDVNGNYCGNTSGGVSPAPYPLTYLGKQQFTAATLATSQTLTVPPGATTIDIYPECTSNGTNNQCVRFDWAATAVATTSAGLASQQNVLGYTVGNATLNTANFILASGATGATNNALTIWYYK